jgi:hypothetical protein
MNEEAMKTRIATKKELKKLNKKAVEAGANALTDEFFDQLRGDLKYPVWQMLAFERGWGRYIVGFGSSPLGDDFQTVMLDMHESEFEKLRSPKDVLGEVANG